MDGFSTSFRRGGKGTCDFVRLSARRAAENEARFRQANEKIAERAVELGQPDQPTPYLCECEAEACTTIVRLTMDEYESVRNGARQFVLAPGHEEEADHVLAEHERFTLVEKTGEEGRRAQALDPRS
jgi:hypothetical protein